MDQGNEFQEQLAKQLAKQLKLANKYLESIDDPEKLCNSDDAEESTTYTNVYNGYFCENGEQAFILVLHPQLQDIIKSNKNYDKAKHTFWYGHNTDPVVVLPLNEVQKRMR